MRVALLCGLLTVAPVAGGPVPTTDPAPPEAPAAFEVTSVRPNASGRNAESSRWFPDGRFQAVNKTLRSLIERAYDLRSPQFQLMGAPGWIETERFDVEAVSPLKVDQYPQRLLLLQALLRDRFGLVVRPQPVDVPSYALVRTQPDAPLPPTLRASTATCDPMANAPDCTVRVARGGGHMVGVGSRIPSLIFVLASRVDRRILDRTGLNGTYDFELTWVPNPVGTTDAAIFGTIEELGLKLEPIMDPMNGYMIERVERPNPN